MNLAASPHTDALSDDATPLLEKLVAHFDLYADSGSGLILNRQHLVTLPRYFDFSCTLPTRADLMGAWLGTRVVEDQALAPDKVWMTIDTVRRHAAQWPPLPTKANPWQATLPIMPQPWTPPPSTSLALSRQLTELSTRLQDVRTAANHLHTAWGDVHAYVGQALKKIPSLADSRSLATFRLDTIGFLRLWDAVRKKAKRVAIAFADADADIA